MEADNGLDEYRWLLHRRKEHQRASDLGLPDSDPDNNSFAITPYHQSIDEKITQGLQSLREGKFVDGETLMAQMDAELAERERQELRG